MNHNLQSGTVLTCSASRFKIFRDGMEISVAYDGWRYVLRGNQASTCCDSETWI